MQSNDVVWLDKICERYCWRLIVVQWFVFFFPCKRYKGFYLAAFSSRSIAQVLTKRSISLQTLVQNQYVQMGLFLHGLGTSETKK